MDKYKHNRTVGLQLLFLLNDYDNYMAAYDAHTQGRALGLLYKRAHELHTTHEMPPAIIKCLLRRERINEYRRVYGETKVYGEAKVYGETKVYGNALVFGTAEVFGDAKFLGKRGDSSK